MTIYPAPKPPRKVKARKPLRSRKPMKRVNAKRGGHMFPTFVDEARREHVRGFPCVACVAVTEWQYSKTQACHLKSRWSGGADEGNLWPGCQVHHEYQHAVGIAAFQRRYRVNLRRVCERVENDFVRVARGGSVTFSEPNKESQ